MNKLINSYLLLCTFLFSYIFIIGIGCSHDPFDPDEFEMDQRDTLFMPQDTMTMGDLNDEDICHPDSVYFVNQVLPILKSNCAFSGCHDSNSAQDGVILDDFKKTIETGEIERFDASESKLYKVIVDDDISDRMPPDPRDPLTQDQITIIADWINQGANNNSCVTSACDLTNLSFSSIIEPIINDNCKGCHSGNSPSGGIELDGYDNIKVHVDNGRLYGSIAYLDGFSRMPKDQDQLDDCTINKIKSWIDNGAPNN